MTDSSDVQHHLERGLFLLSRGMVYEARQSWRAALRIEPTNSAALDYLESTECELNDYDRKREEEAKAAEAASGLVFQEVTEADVAHLTAPDTGFELPDTSGLSGVPAAAPFDETPDDAVLHRGDESLEEPAGVPDGSTESEAEVGTLDTGRPPVRAEGSAGPAAPLESVEVPGSDVIPEEALEADLVDMEDGWHPLDWLVDEEPVEALPEESEPDEETDSVPETVTGDASVGEPPVHDTQAVLQEVEELRAGRRYAAARRLLQAHLATHPGQEALLEELERVEREMQAHYAGILGDLASVPELTVDVEELYSLDLDQVGGYIISLVDGILTLEDIFTLSAKLDRLTVMQVLGELIEKDLIVLRPG